MTPFLLGTIGFALFTSVMQSLMVGTFQFYWIFVGANTISVVTLGGGAAIIHEFWALRKS